ncbi:MAG: SCO family protein [Microthrixaceae bacterium]
MPATLALLLASLAVLALVGTACGADNPDDSAGSGDTGAGDTDGSGVSADQADPPDGDEPDTYSGYVVDPPVSVAEVTLPVADGSDEMTMVAQPGGLEVVYFGYTFCPDVCPTTMADVRKALAELPADEADRVGVSMLTIDPARDTAEVLDAYIANFVDDGVALRTEDDTRLRAAADAFGANYEVTTNDEGDIEVKHTGELYAVDDTGTIVMQWPFGTSYESLARDLRSLLAETEQA